MEEGKVEKDFYEENFREDLEENDEIDAVEEAFMQGYEQGENVAKCANCKVVLADTNFVEEEADGKVFRFCSIKCAENFHKS